MESSDLFVYALLVIAALALWIVIKVVKKVMVTLLVMGVLLILGAVVYFRVLE
ncbi:MAG: hypothetical protein ACKVRP_01805 [Bacteroidota bacterium]